MRFTDVSIEFAGEASGLRSENPESLLGQYDIVFAKGRCAREALAVGCSVIISDSQGLGQMVTSANVERLARMNFGRRLLQHQHIEERVVAEIRKHDSDDAEKASNFIRKRSGLHQLVGELLSTYQRVAREHQQESLNDPANEFRQIADYLRRWSTEMTDQHQREVARLSKNPNPSSLGVHRAA